MKKALVIILIVASFYSCGSNDNELKKWIDLKLNYYRVGNNVVLAIEILNNGEKDLWGFHPIKFFVNEKEFKSPFKIPKFWLFKAMIPSNPKYLFEYLKIDELILILGSGKHRIRLEYGPVVSNELELEVINSHFLKENKVLYSPYVKEVGDSVFRDKGQ